MKVALVHDFLVKLGGAERVLETLAEMYPEAPIYTLLYDEKTVGNVFPKNRVKTSFLQNFPGFFRKRYRYLFSLMPLAIERFDFSKYDVVISSSNSYSHGILTGTNTKHICYCHSPMRYCWDWAHQYLKENKVSGMKLKYIRERLHKMRIWDKTVADRPDLYLANSVNTKKRIGKYYRLDSEVVYPPVDVNRFSVSENSEDFFLIVSAITPFKKIDLAVEAFNKLGKKLVIIGDGPQREELEKKAEKNITFTGFLGDKEVASYLRRCRAFIFPGEEDFGIAPVEAMACGKPVIAYGKGGLLESVVENETGVFFHEPTVQSLVGAIQKYFDNSRAFDPQVIRERAEKFGREEFEERIRKIVENPL
jgi:glycosyltransferase involved in cell wall biosynthesis